MVCAGGSTRLKLVGLFVKDRENKLEWSKFSSTKGLDIERLTYYNGVHSSQISEQSPSLSPQAILDRRRRFLWYRHYI